MFTKLIKIIQDKIFDNRTRGVSVKAVRDTMLAMVETLGKGMVFFGIADENTDVSDIEQNVFFIAWNDGDSKIRLENFNVEIEPSEVVIIRNTEESWKKINLPFILSEESSKTVIVPVKICKEDWDECQAVISVDGVKDEDIQSVSVVPRTSSAQVYNDSEVICIAQENGELTFICSVTPNSDLELNVFLSEI